MRIIVMCAVLALAACATRSVEWEKPGASEQDVAGAKYACQRQSREANLGIGANAMDNQVEYVRKCMGRRGYAERQSSQRVVVFGLR